MIEKIRRENREIVHNSHRKMRYGSENKEKVCNKYKKNKINTRKL